MPSAIRDLIPYVFRNVLWVLIAVFLVLLISPWRRRCRSSTLTVLGTSLGFSALSVFRCPPTLQNGIQLKIPGTDLAGWFLAFLGIIYVLIAIRQKAALSVKGDDGIEDRGSWVERK